MPFWKRKDIKREYKNQSQYRRICVYGESESMFLCKNCTYKKQNEIMEKLIAVQEKQIAEQDNLIKEQRELIELQKNIIEVGEWKYDTRKQETHW